MQIFRHLMPRDMRTIFTIGVLCATVSLSVPTLQCHAALLQDVDVVDGDGSTYVILQFDEKVRYVHDYLPVSDTLPARCYIDLFSTNMNQSLQGWLQVDGQRITKIRTGSYSTKLRFVVDLTKDYPCVVESFQTEPFQIRISVSEKEPSEESQTAFTGSKEAENQPADRDIEMSETQGLDETKEQRETAKSFSQSTDAAGADTSLPEFTDPDKDALSFWGWAQYYAAHDTRKQDAEDHKLSRVQGRLGAEWEKDLGPESSLEMHAAVAVDRIYYDSDLAKEETEVDIDETYLQYNRPNWDVSAGKQRVRWGKSDQLSPINSINPQDLRQFIAVDLEERTLPSWMLRNRWYGNSVGLETIIQPWFKKSEIDYFDSDWAIYRNLRRAIMENPSAPAALKDYTEEIRVNADKPSKSLDNVSAAARFTWQTDQTDFAVSYHYGWETLPTITSFPVKNISYSGGRNIDLDQLLEDAVFTDERVQAKYKRQRTIGFEWETVFDPIGFRGEIAHIDNVAFLTSDLTSVRRAVTPLVSGIDYVSTTEWYFNLQGSWHHIHDYNDEILYFEKDTVAVFGEISKPVWRGNLVLSTKYNYTLTDKSSYFQPSITLKYFRNLESEIGAMFFDGDEDTLMGSYDHADQVYLRLRAFF